MRWRSQGKVVCSGALTFDLCLGDGGAGGNRRPRRDIRVGNDRILAQTGFECGGLTGLYVVNDGRAGRAIVELESLSSWNFGCDCSWRGRKGRQAAKPSASAPREKSQSVACARLAAGSAVAGGCGTDCSYVVLTCTYIVGGLGGKLHQNRIACY